MYLDLTTYTAQGTVPQASMCDYVRYLEALREGVYVALHRCRHLVEPDSAIVDDLFAVAGELTEETRRAITTSSSYLMPLF